MTLVIRIEMKKTQTLLPPQTMSRTDFFVARIIIIVKRGDLVHWYVRRFVVLYAADPGLITDSL